MPTVILVDPSGYGHTHATRRTRKEDSSRDCQAERLGGVEVDDQFELGGLLDGQIGALRPLDPAGYGSPLPHFLLRLAI